MASLQKLSIRGVRAFSPDDEEQVIEFYSPLTIIVGANGCGKTTIIESLKYVVTGSMPPGIKNGQAFVHDPRSCNQSSVKANIKLRFNNKAGKSMVVIRSMEVTQKKSMMSFKALDGVIRSTGPTGEKVTLSHKCTELDKQIPDLIGVSAPILEHVIFCHQEESSWPLQEGAVLKKRFDEIFDSTRYAKALDAIRKSRLEYSSKVKDVKAELAGYSAHLQGAQGLQGDLDEAQSRFDKIEAKNVGYEDEKKEQLEVAQKLAGKIADVEEMKDREKEQAENLRNHNGIVQSQKGMMEKVMKEDEKELQTMLEEFDNAVEEGEGGYEKLQEEYDSLKSDLEKLNEIRIEKMSSRGGLNTANEQNEIMLVQRNSLIDAVVAQHGLKLPAGIADASDLSGAQFTTAMNMLQAKKAELEEGVRSARHNLRKEDDKIQMTIGELTAKQKQIEERRKGNGSSRTAFESRLSAISATISSQSRISKSEVEDAARQAKLLCAERDNASNNGRLMEIPQEIKKDETVIHELQLKIEEVNEGLEQLRACSDEENAVAMLQKQLQQETHRLEETCKDMLERFPQFSVDLEGLAASDLPSMERSNQNVHRKLASKKDEGGKLKGELEDKQREVTETTALIKFKKITKEGIAGSVARSKSAVDSITAVAAEIRAHDIQHVGLSQIPAEGVIDGDLLLRECQSSLREIDEATVSPALVKKILKKIRNMAMVKGADGEVEKTACPCCSKEFDGNDELDTFKGWFKTQMSPDTSTLMDGADGNNEEMKAKYNAWISTIEENLGGYKDGVRLGHEVSKVEAEIKETEEKLLRCQGDFDSAKAIYDTCATGVSELEGLEGELNRLLSGGNGLADKRGEVESKKKNLEAYAPSSEGKSLREVEAEVSKHQGDKEARMKTIQDLNKEMSNINRTLQLSTTRAAAAEKTASDKEVQYAQFGTNDKQRSEIREGIAQCNALEAELREQEAPLRQDIGKAESEKERMRETASKEEAKLGNQVAEYNSSLMEISSMNSKISNFNPKAKNKELLELEAEISGIEQNIAEKNAEVKGMEPQIAALKDRMGDRDRQKKVILDNISYRQNLAKVVEMEEELEAMTAEIASIEKSDKSNEQYRTARARIEELKGKVLKNTGNKDALGDQIAQLEGKLNSKEYKNVAERHRSSMIQYEITSIAVQDLEKYHAAVDKALLRYHSLKIEDINKIIKELWSLTYKGQDITNIRIVSGNEGAATSSAASRSYNYRVAMRKGNTEMDMRGRCSAGQRVLASIVIRLALAETFCISCGVLALDEPTTNLDYENKRGLAIALAQIIANRSTQHNFQLIAITHDEDFVSMMKQELGTQTQGSFSMPESYFFISRKEGNDGKHYSKIEKIDWDEL